MSQIRLRDLWIDASKQLSSQTSAIDYLTSLREKNDKSDLDLCDQINHIDDVAMSYLMIPTFKGSLLVTALLINSGISGQFVKTLSNIIPKDLLAKVLSTPKVNLSHQYKRKSLNHSRTESVVGFVKIWSELMVLFKNRSELVNQWLVNEKIPLGGNSPISLIDTTPGREVISDIIYRIKSGDLS